MSPVLFALAFLLLIARGMRAIGAALLHDLQADAPFVGAEESSADTLGPQARTSVPEHSRVPLNRVLAFRGVSRRVSARRRWQGGFGRGCL